MSKLKKELQQLSDLEVYKILWYVRFCWLRNKVRQLTPSKIVLPVTLLQIFAFIFSMLHKDFIRVAILSNLIVVGIALIPMTLKKPKPKVHWIKLGGDQ